MEQRPLEDRDLVRRLLAGDEVAFTDFFDAYAPRLYRFTLSRVGQDPDIAEEIVQRTLLKVVGKLGTFRAEAPLFSWLCTFCRHEISGFYKGSRRLAEREVAVDDLEAVVDAGRSPERATQPETDVLRREVADRVRSTLDAMPARYCEVLELKYIEGLSVKQIAERLAVGPVVVQSCLSRARRAFREAFGPLRPVLSRVRRADV